MNQPLSYSPVLALSWMYYASNALVAPADAEEAASLRVTRDLAIDALYGDEAAQAALCAYDAAVRASA